MFARARRLAVISLLGLILVTAFALRVFGLNWDDNHHIHPDERWITMVALDTYVPAEWSDALNPRRSALNPYWDLRANQPRHFAYGSFPLYLVRLVATAIGDVASLKHSLHRKPTDAKGFYAVYFGLKHFTARAKVGFSLAELPEVMATLLPMTGCSAR